MADVNWGMERTEVIRDLALLRQQLVDLCEDVRGLRGDLAAAMVSQATSREARIKADATVDEHGRRLADLERRVMAIESLVPVLKVVLWVGGALGASVMALIWAMITGQAALVFP